MASRSQLRMAGRMAGFAFPKPSRTARKQAEKKDRLELQKHERDEKAEVRRRDRVCRFPLCGCRRLGLRLEVSHQDHKGAGGNPTGSRSQAKSMILLCTHRHQDGAYSRHKGTMKVKALTRAGTDGPCAFLVQNLSDMRWHEVARESLPGVLEPLTPWQQQMLCRLREMTD